MQRQTRNYLPIIYQVIMTRASLVENNRSVSEPNTQPLNNQPEIKPQRHGSAAEGRGFRRARCSFDRLRLRSAQPAFRSAPAAACLRGGGERGSRGRSLALQRKRPSGCVAPVDSEPRTLDRAKKLFVPVSPSPSL